MTFACFVVTLLSMQPVKPTRVVDQDLFRQRLRHVFAGAEGLDQPFLSGRVVVAVVRADDDVIFADAFGQIRNVFVGFAGDEQIIVAE